MLGAEWEPPVTKNCNPVAYVIGPNGDVLTEADLPPPGTTRWVSRRKAEIIIAVDGGLLSVTDACRRYHISHEEFRGWVRAYERSGLLGLRARCKRTRPEMGFSAETHFARAESDGKVTRQAKTSVSTSAPDPSA